MDEIACPLCKIRKVESLLYEDDEMFLVKTKKMKGHDVRVMAVIDRHSVEPTFEERTKAYFLVNEYMKSRLGDKPWYMVDNTFASIKDHWHLMACDDHTEDRQELQQMRLTPKVAFPLKFSFEGANE